MERSRLEGLEKQLTTTLTGWGVTSAAVGSALWLAGWRTGRTDLLRFGRQTALWGATDVAIAMAGARDRRRRGELDQVGIDRKARTLQITLIVNGLADVAYVAGGARVWARTTPSHPTYWGMGRGDAAAIVIQGAFLLVLDAAFALRVTLARS